LWIALISRDAENRQIIFALLDPAKNLGRHHRGVKVDLQAGELAVNPGHEPTHVIFAQKRSDADSHNFLVRRLSAPAKQVGAGRQDRPHEFERVLAFGREDRRRAPTALEEEPAKPLLKNMNMLADCWLGDVQQLGRLCETACLRSAGKCAQLGKSHIFGDKLEQHRPLQPRSVHL